ncbi:hypothetical protein P8A22_29395 [Streptomyces laculatispora]|uniref:Uncharacterized protein n=1 Tax=Streptomyces laculatispora TaxID=887464 RepID=A0ABY9IAI4_9ACTN|nr:hypothetical protein [Streptomyces laculatispora]WLQ43674.1 hypothetical protein P8A22_29395 [Streptomyces laculatispora]
MVTLDFRRELGSSVEVFIDLHANACIHEEEAGMRRAGMGPGAEARRGRPIRKEATALHSRVRG